MWDFVKNAIVDDVSTVPEQFRGVYEKGQDGKFHLTAAAKPLVDAYVGTTTALNKANKDLSTANNEAAGRRVTTTAVVELLKKLGVETIDEANPLLSAETFVGELITKSKANKDLNINLESIKREYGVRETALKAANDKTLSDMRTSLEKHLIGDQVLTALTKHGGNPVFLSDLVKKSVKVVNENGEYTVRVVNEAGEPRLNGAGGWQNIDGLVSEMKTNTIYAAAFASEAKGGTGKPANSSAQQQQTQKKDGEKSPTDKIISGLSKGQYDRPGAAQA